MHRDGDVCVPVCVGMKHSPHNAAIGCSADGQGLWNPGERNRRLVAHFCFGLGIDKKRGNQKLYFICLDSFNLRQVLVTWWGFSFG